MHPDDQFLPETLADIRPEVLRFAMLMEAKLRKHDGDRGRDGWKDEYGFSLAGMLAEHEKKLYAQLIDRQEVGSQSERQVAYSAADVGNFAMMIADVEGGLPPLPAPQPQPDLYMGMAAGMATFIRPSGLDTKRLADALRNWHLYQREEDRLQLFELGIAPAAIANALRILEWSSGQR